MRYRTTVGCKELADARGIRAHVIAPGATETPLPPSFWANAERRPAAMRPGSGPITP